MKPKLMQEYRCWQTYGPAGTITTDFGRRLCSAGGNCIGWALLFPSASALPLTNELCLLEWIPFSYFVFPAPFPAQFPQLPVLQAFSPASILTTRFPFFPLGLFSTLVSPALPFPLCVSTLVFHSFLLCPLPMLSSSAPPSVNWCWLFALTVQNPQPNGGQRIP